MSNQLPYRLEIDNRRAIVALLPELNEVPWADIEKVGSEILSRIQSLSSPALLVDLCALNYMGSAQVALVVRMFKTVKEKNGKMVVANRDPMVLEVLSLAGLNKVWTIVDSRERAMSMLGGGPMASSSSSGGGGRADYAANPMPGMLAMVAAMVAAIFLVIHVANPALIPSRGDLLGGLASSAVAFLAGLWTVNSGNRNLGIGVLVVSMAMLLYGVFEIAKPASGAPAPAQTAPAETTTDPTNTAPATTPEATPPTLPPGGGTIPAPANPLPGGQPAPSGATPPTGAVPPAVPGSTPPATTPPAATPPATTTPDTTPPAAPK